MTQNEITAPLSSAAVSRTAPFALFMAFIGVGETMQFLGNRGWLAVQESDLYYLYPVKTLCVAAVLLHYLSEYSELQWKNLLQWRRLFVTCGIGVATCVLWVWLDWTLSVTGAPPGFNPAHLPQGFVRVAMTLFRVCGAVVVVPVMEEVFWRSFLLRYLINADFESVPIGSFTWPSFLITTVLFGLEHHVIVAGMAAGAIYNLTLYKTRSIALCVLTHAATNLTLACYVLVSGKWYFW